MKKTLFLFYTILMMSCSTGQNKCGDFDLNHPDELIKLPVKLKEISGITFLSKNKIACVQDEKGTIFIYDIHKDKLKESIDFGGDKDYEAIANVNDTIFVLRSNGDIYEIDSLETNGVEAVIHHTFLSKVNDCEGMCYDPKHDRLLIACKGRPEKGSAKKYEKAVYAFDLKSRAMFEEPVLIFDPKIINEAVINSNRLSSREEANGAELFEPSEIAIEPLSGNYFILSAVGKKLAVFSITGQLICATALDPAIYKQPEGLAFSTVGDLIISDEGKNGKGNLVVLKIVNSEYR